MNYTISPCRNRLTIAVSRSEQVQLRRLSKDGDFLSDDTMHDFLERLVCNSELQWINPDDTGDLTDAPMLGILGEEKNDELACKERSFGVISTGPGRYAPIMERFAFMDYQVRSVLEDLRDKGEAIFVNSN